MRSCFSVIEIVLRHLDDRSVAGVEIIAYDFQKAFDKIDHCRLIARLAKLNLPADFVSWTCDYLSNRSQRVRIGKLHSDLLPVSSGVPQGSLLGPFLFCLFISDLAPINPVDNSIMKYADDCMLIIPIKDSGSSSCSIQCENNNVVNWSKRNLLPLNLKKCSITSFSNRKDFCSTLIPDIPVIGTNSLKYLGVVITSDLKWNKHISLIARRASDILYILRSIRPYCTNKEMITAYCAYSRKIIEYANPVFAGLPRSLQIPLNKVQRRAHRIICGCRCAFFES